MGYVYAGRSKYASKYGFKYAINTLTERVLDAEKRINLKAKAFPQVTSDDDMTQTVSNTGTMDQNPSSVDDTAMARREYEKKFAEYVSLILLACSFLS